MLPGDHSNRAAAGKQPVPVQHADGWLVASRTPERAPELWRQNNGPEGLAAEQQVSKVLQVTAAGLLQDAYLQLGWQAQEASLPRRHAGWCTVLTGECFREVDVDPGTKLLRELQDLVCLTARTAQHCWSSGSKGCQQAEDAGLFAKVPHTPCRLAVMPLSAP